MGSDSGLSIVILYCHALLGEGIGRLLSREPGAEVMYLPCAEPDCLARATAARPSVVLVERCGVFDAIELVAAFPDALVIDFEIGPGQTWAYRRQKISSSPTAIVQLVQRLRIGHPEIAVEQPDAGEAELLIPTR